MRWLASFTVATAGVLAVAAVVWAHAPLRQSGPTNDTEAPGVPGAVTM